MSEQVDPEPVHDRPAETELAPDVAAARDAADAEAAITGSALDPTLEAVLENCRIEPSRVSRRPGYLVSLF